MATFDLPTFPEPRVNPQFLIGAASPLWGFYGAATASGVTYWWLTRWAQPLNVEALFGALANAPEALADAAKAAVEAVEAPLEALGPVGGEAAPISPLVEILPPEIVVEAETTLDAVADAVQEAVSGATEAAADMIEAIPETFTTEPAVEVAPESPIIPASEPSDPETAPKSRARKGPSTADYQA